MDGIVLHTPRTRHELNKQFFGGGEIGSAIAHGINFARTDCPIVFQAPPIDGPVVRFEKKQFESLYRNCSKTSAIRTARQAKLTTAGKNSREKQLHQRRDMDKFIEEETKNQPERSKDEQPQSRKENLSKWRQEKTEKIRKEIRKPPFRAGKFNEMEKAPVATKKYPLTGTMAKATSSSHIPVTSSKQVPSSTTAKAEADKRKELKKDEVQERRVTRAMAAGAARNPGVAAKLPATTKPPATTKLHTTTKQPATGKLPGVPSKPATSAKQPQTGRRAEIKSGKTVRADASNSTTTLSTPIPTNRDTVAVTSVVSKESVQQKPESESLKTKPAKGNKLRGLDKCYMEFNGNLSDCHRKLEMEKNYWVELMRNSNDISEEHAGDIDSLVGKIGLLLKSKLPQFAQMLYYYLNNNGEDGELLECDLAGWWAVASLQIEQVLSSSQKLKALYANGWKEILPVQIPTKPLRKKAVSAGNDTTSIKHKKQPSSGLLNFIKKQRAAKSEDAKSGSQGINVLLVEKRTSELGNKTNETGPSEDSPKLIEFPFEEPQSIDTENKTAVPVVSVLIPAPVSINNEDTVLTEPIESEINSATILADSTLDVNESCQVSESWSSKNSISPVRAIASNSQLSFRTPQAPRVGALRSTPNRRHSLITLKIRKSMGAFFKRVSNGGDDHKHDDADASKSPAAEDEDKSGNLESILDTEACSVGDEMEM